MSSERSWQKADRGLWRAKNADTFKPMGPWIETSVDLDKMETIVSVNGKQSNRFHTNDMIFGIKPFIVELTKYFTLWPGDVIWMAEPTGRHPTSRRATWLKSKSPASAPCATGLSPEKVPGS